MAFVFEDVPKADWELYNSFKLKSYNGKEELVADKYAMWRVDRERNIYFICLGGGAFEQARIYALIWQGEKLLIHLDSYAENMLDASTRVHWDICRIIAPKSLESKKDEIISLIKEIAYLDIDAGEMVIDNIADPIYVDVVEC